MFMKTIILKRRYKGTVSLIFKLALLRNNLVIDMKFISASVMRHQSVPVISKAIFRGATEQNCNCVHKSREHKSQDDARTRFRL